jgi:uncharacterized protein YqhQ
MDAITQMQVFFFISSAGFIILFILVAVFLFYLICAMNTFSRIMEKIEKDMNNLSDSTKDLFEYMRSSAIFNFLFGKKRKHKKD